MLRRRGLLGLALAVLAALSACTRADAPGTAGIPGARHSWTIPDTLRIGTGLVPRALNPILNAETIDGAISRLYSDILVTVDARGNFVPDLAAEVPTRANGDVSADGLAIRYKLRSNVTWQDGQPFSSRDVKFTYDAIMNPQNNVISRHGYDVVQRVDTPDAHTIVFHLKRRFAPFVATVFGESDSPYGILPEHILGKEKNINNVPFNALPIGTGPFKVTRWLRGNQINFVRNDAYFLGKPKVKAIVMKFIPDENTEITQLRTHEIDWLFEPSVNGYKALRKLPTSEVRTVLTPINGYYGLLMNTAHGSTEDVRVRRAIQYVLDKSELTRSLTFGAADAATEDLPPFMWAYDRSLRPTQHDPLAAKALLAQAGYGPSHRLSLEMYYEQSAAINKATSIQIQSALEVVGIDVHLHAESSTLLYSGYAANGTLARGRYDLALLPWNAGIDPDDSAQFTCANRPPNGYNVSFSCDATMDAAQNVALDSYDPKTRSRAYARVQRALSNDVPLDFLWWPKQIQAVNPDLKGFDPNPVVATWNAWRWSI